MQNLITIVLSWPTWIIPNAKQTSFQNMICQSYLRLCISQKDSAILKDKNENHICDMGRASHN